MARKFLVPIDLDKNSLLNATLHPSGTAPSSPVAGQVWYDSTNNVLKVYNGSSWITLADASSAGVTSLAGTANEITVSGSTGSVTVGLPDDVQITNNLTIGGNLTVNGTTTTVNSETVSIADNIIVLNSDVTGSPSANAGIEVERGTSTNASVLWDETADKWKVGLVGSETEISVVGHGHTSADVSDFTEAAQDAVSTFIIAGSGISKTHDDGANTLTIANSGVLSVAGNTGTVSATNLLDAIKTVDGATTGLDADLLDGNHASAFALSSHTHTSADVTDFNEAAQDAVNAMIIDTDSVNFTYTDGTPELKADVKLKTDSYLTIASGAGAGVGIDVATFETKLVTDGFAKKYVGTVTGDSSTLTFAFSHGLATRDVMVNVYDGTSYETVETDVTRTSTSQVTIGFTTAPTTGKTYKVVIIG